MKRARAELSVIESSIAELRGMLEQKATPERRAADRAYLKMPPTLSNLGCTVPDVTNVVKTWHKKHITTADDLLETGRKMWFQDVDVYELRLSASKMLCKCVVPLVSSEKEETKEKCLSLVEQMLDTAGTWALVDELAPHVARPVLQMLSPQRHRAVLDAWSSHSNFWLKRACLLTHLVPLRTNWTKEDFESFSRYAVPMLLPEKEFFLQKAIGWILRDTSKKSPQVVYEFCMEHAPRLSTVTHREAVKKLTEKQRKEIAGKRN